jgi:hypothetical protein
MTGHSSTVKTANQQPGIWHTLRIHKTVDKAMREVEAPEKR